MEQEEKLRLLLEERAKRTAAQSGVEELCERITKELFDKQIDFLHDECKFKAVLGSRRAGKTEMWVRYSTIEALKNPRTMIRIWHSSRLRAKEMLWAAFIYLHKRHGIKTKTNETELSITFQNGSSIKLVGADKDKEAQKKRGDKTILEIILEVQNFGPFLRSMIDDVIEPSLLDWKGTLCVEGTPGPICAGTWFEISGGNNTARRWRNQVLDQELGAKVPGQWSCHRWTLLDNPFVPHARQWLEDKKRARRWADDHPTYLREYCGQWVDDFSALFYKFDLTRNTYTVNEIKPWGPGWQHALGWDLGFRDHMALVIWGWHPEYPNLYEVFSWKLSGLEFQGSLADEVMKTIQEQETEKSLNLIEQVADTGGGGRMYVEEVMSRFTRHFTAAKKTDKFEHVRLFNDELLTGRVKLLLGSPYQVEIAGVMKDPDWEADPEKTEKAPTEDPRTPNHCSDAGLYAWRACWHYVPADPKVVKPRRGSEQEIVNWLDKAAKKIENQNDFFDESRWGFGANNEDA